MSKCPRATIVRLWRFVDENGVWLYHENIVAGLNGFILAKEYEYGPSCILVHNAKGIVLNMTQHREDSLFRTEALPQISYLFMLLATLMCVFSWWMFLDSTRESPSLLPDIAYFLPPAFLLLWWFVCCLTSCVSGLAIRPLFSDGIIGLRRFALISQLYRIVFFILIFLFVVFLLLYNFGEIFHWLEKYIILFENEIALGIPVVIFLASLAGFSVFRINSKGMWLIGNFFMALASIGAALTAMNVLPKL